MSTGPVTPNPHSLTPERIGRVIKGATYGWMIALGIKAYQRKTDEGATPEEAIKGAAWAAWCGPALTAWFMYVAWVTLAKVGYLLTPVTLQVSDNHSWSWAISHFAFAVAICVAYFALASAIIVYEWATRCGWEKLTKWRLYSAGMYLRANGWTIKPWVLWLLSIVLFRV